MFRVIVLMGICFAMVTGCGPQENQAAATEEPTLTFMAPPTETHRISTTQAPSEAVPSTTPRPSATPRSTAEIPALTEISQSENVFVREGVPVPQPEEVIGVENADQLVEMARWGYGAIQRVIHSTDGQLMLVQSDAGVYAYHVGTLDEVWRFQPEGEVTALEVDQDGRVLVEASEQTVYQLVPSD